MPTYCLYRRPVQASRVLSSGEGNAERLVYEALVSVVVEIMAESFMCDFGLAVRLVRDTY